jgi:hypothetical protein
MTANPATLDVRGYRDEPLVHAYMQHEPAVSALGLMLPGKGYGITAPGLLYSAHVLSELGFDTFALETRYQTTAFQAVPQREALEWLKADAQAAYQAAWDARPYTQLCIVAKSLGTVGLTLLLSSGTLPAQARFVWLTPLLSRPELLEQMLLTAARSLVVIGNQDPEYHPVRLEALAAAGAQLLVLGGADHSFRVSGDTVAFLDNLRRIRERLRAFAPSWRSV